MSPFFYKDLTDFASTSEATFFVQPSLTEVTLSVWRFWAVPAIPGNYLPVLALSDVPIAAQTPRAQVPVDRGDPVYSLYTLEPKPDWVTNAATVLTYGGTPIGSDGGLDLPANATRPASGAAQSRGQLNGGASFANLRRVVITGGGLSNHQLQQVKVAQSATPAFGARASIKALRGSDVR